MNRRLPWITLLVVAGAVTAAALSAQTPSSGRVPLAEDVFKNVQTLQGIPVDEFMDTMGMFSAATGLNCTNCHQADNSTSWDSYAVETRLKQSARRMLRMVNALNKDNFGGTPTITCYTCHHGDQRNGRNHIACAASGHRAIQGSHRGIAFG